MADIGSIIAPFGGVGGSLGGILDMFKYILIIIVLAFLGFVIYQVVAKLIKYKINVEIFSKRGDRFKKLTDKGAIIKDKSGEIFRLLKKRRILPVPDFSYFTLGTRGKTYLSLLEVGTDELYPMHIKVVTDGNPKAYVGLKPVQKDMLAWNVYAKDQMRKKFEFQNFLQQYGQMISMGVIAGLVIVVVYLSYSHMSEISAQLGPIAESLKGVAQSITNAAGSSGGSAPW